MARLLLLSRDVRTDDTQAARAATAQGDGRREYCCAAGTREDRFEAYRDGRAIPAAAHDFL
jgi:hypothetical protein